MTSKYEDKTDLLNVSFEFPLGLDIGNLLDTYSANNTRQIRRRVVYQTICATWRRTAVKEMKAYPTICKPNNNVNWGLPKLERRKAMAVAHEYLIWQRSFRSSPRTVTPFTWRREAVKAN